MSEFFPLKIVNGQLQRLQSGDTLKADRIKASTSGVVSPLLTLGREETNASPQASVVKGEDGSGTNLTGGDIEINAGIGTGTGASGSVKVKTHAGGSSGSSPGSPTDALIIGPQSVTIKRNLNCDYGIAALSGDIEGINVYADEVFRSFGTGQVDGLFTALNFKRNAGTPESSLTADKGVITQDTTNGELYVKHTGSGDTGHERLVRYSELAGLGGGASSGAMADIPSAGTSGRLYLANDHPYLFYDTGSIWTVFSDSQRVLTPPTTTGFSWANQDGATITATEAGLVLSKANSGASTTCSVYYKTAPSTPYTLTARIRLISAKTATAGYNFGVGWRQSSDGKFVGTGLGFDSSGQRFMVVAYKFNSPTSFNSAPYESSFSVQSAPGEFWVRITDNGTNRIFEYSIDGNVFYTVFTEGRTTFLTADELMIFINNYNSGGTLTFIVDHWVQS